eukprot:4196324-Alexandrium_andersonii.AAC.1
MRDADVWAWLHGIVSGCKGGSFAVTKVKSHTEMEHLEVGVARDGWRQGNDFADEVARHAMQDFDSDLRSYVSHTNRRH